MKSVDAGLERPQAEAKVMVKSMNPDTNEHESEMKLARAIQAYFIARQADGERSQDVLLQPVGAAMERLISHVMTVKRKWGTEDWADGVLFHEFEVSLPRTISLTRGVLIWNSRKACHIDPIWAQLVIRPGGHGLQDYRLKIGNAVLGLGALKYGSRSSLFPVKRWAFQYSKRANRHQLAD
jgi:hypothetical protein